MRYNFSTVIQEARKKKSLSQEALASASGVSRITIARLEAGGAADFRLGTLNRLCAALGLELAALPAGTQAPAGLAPQKEGRGRARRLDTRRRHAALAAALLAITPGDAADMIGKARAEVDRWEKESLFTQLHISHWRSRLEGPVRTVALCLLEYGEGTDVLLENSPWSFALEPAAA